MENDAVMDIVYLVKTDPENDSEELRYSLRSLKNVPHDKVVLVGEKPDWATNVTFIPVPQVYTKPVNVGMNMRAAVASELISEEFILMNDDFFFMKPITQMPTLNFGFMKDVLELYRRRYPQGSAYMESMEALYNLLRSKGVEQPVSYELHLPMVFSKSKIQLMWDTVKGPLYQFRTYYGNHYMVVGQSVSDVKVFLGSEHNDPAYETNPQAYLEAQTFLSATGGSFKRGLPGDFIRAQFQDKSVYEL